MRILLLSAYDALSHRYWREALVEQFPAYQWTALALAPRYFNYRIRGNPLSWVDKNRTTLEQSYDLLIATSMVDIATLRGLLPSLANTPLWLYCHENQFAYPVSEHQKPLNNHRLDAQMVFLYSCLAADSISFNSAWNRSSALAGLTGLFAKLPEKLDRQLLEQIADKSDVLPVPLLPAVEPLHNANKIPADKRPALLWNHRWEYDKGPEILLALVAQLIERRVLCEIHIVGQQFREQPDAFTQIKILLAAENCTVRLGQWGYLPLIEYHLLLQSSDVVLSTAHHDFQGIAVLEAVQAGCVPLLPDHLVYPELFASDYCYRVSDQADATAGEIVNRLLRWFTDGLPVLPAVSALSWTSLKIQYASKIESLR